jgi:hypothetical protein
MLQKKIMRGGTDSLSKHLEKRLKNRVRVRRGPWIET